jgi:RNA polymerase sigma-70 factor (ECF subfamily)
MYTAAIGHHRSPVSHRHYATAALEASLLARVHRAKTARVIDGRGHVTRVAALSRVPAGRRSAHRNPDWGTVSEVQLRDAMLSLDAGAWREFHKRYDALIAGAASKVVSKGRNASDAVAEIKGNVYASLLANDLHKLRAWDAARGQRLGSFIYMVSGNAAWDYVRGSKYQRRSTSIDTQVGYDTDPLTLEFADATPDAFVRTASRAELAKVMSVLNEDERAIVRLSLIEGLPSKVVAEQLGIKPGTVDIKVHRIRAKLAEAMAG